jgi:hypothetical protein
MIAGNVMSAVIFGQIGLLVTNWNRALTSYEEHLYASCPFFRVPHSGLPLKLADIVISLIAFAHLHACFE